MYDEEALDENFAADFSEKRIRLGFVRKVYGILTAQLLVTVGIICLFLFVDNVKRYSKENTWVYIVALVLSIVVLLVLACCESMRRTAPWNFMFLFIFTILEGYLLGAISASADTEAVLMAAGITTVVAIGLTIFALQTKWDFTMMGGLLLVLTLVLMLFGLLCLFIRARYAIIAYASLGALLFSAYLVFDTQLMLGGKHKYSLSPEEYIFAALNLYLDIVNLFLFILTIIQGTRN